MGLFNTFPNTDLYNQDLGYLINEYKRLNDKYDTLVQIYEIVQKEIKDITLEQLQKWLDDGTFENIILSSLNKYQYYNTFIDFVTANNFIENSIIITNGFYEDMGLMSIYEIKKGTKQDIYDYTINDEWYARLKYPLNCVESYGIDMNGTKDISTFINELIMYQKQIYFPKGIYLLNNPLRLKDYTHLKGAGKFATVLKVNTINDGIVINDKTFCKVEGFQLVGTNMWDDGQPIKQNGQNGIHITDGNCHEIKNCVIWNMQESGIKIDYAGRQTPIQINFYDMYVKNNSKYGLYASQVHGLIYQGTNLEHNGESNIYIDGGCIDVKISNINCNFTDKMTGSTIVLNNDFETDCAILENIHIEDNGVLNNERSVPCILSNSNSCLMQNVYIRYSKAYTYAMELMKYASVIGCVIRNMKNAINIIPTTGAYLRGNRFSNLTGTAVTGSGGIYNENFVPRTVTSTLNFNKENMHYNIDSIITKPYLSRYVYTAKIHLLSAISVIQSCRIDYYLYGYHSNLISTGAIQIADFTNNQYDITSLMRTAGVEFARFQLVTTNATGNANLLITLTGS